MTFVEIKGNDYTLAPKIIDKGDSIIMNPSDQDYLQDDRYYELIQNRPEEKEGFDIVEDGFAVEGKKLVVKYKYVEKVLPSLQYSKYKIISKIMGLGKWDSVKSWLQESGYLDLFNAALILDEEDCNFKTGLLQFCQHFNKTEQEVRNFISDCVV